jgi:hypothetical protein
LVVFAWDFVGSFCHELISGWVLLVMIALASVGYGFTLSLVQIWLSLVPVIKATTIRSTIEGQGDPAHGTYTGIKKFFGGF